jgi:hypothetical protein
MVQWNFTIPATTPPGLYILRVSSIYPNTRYNAAQFYVNCAQVEIVGAGGAGSEPGPKVGFPGAFGLNDPSKLRCTNEKKYDVYGADCSRRVD